MISTRLAAAMNRRGVHYGWVVVATTFLTMLVTAGAVGAPGVLLLPLQREYGWSTAAISSALATRLLLFGLMGPFAAAFINRYGVRRVTLSALCLIGLGLALSLGMTYLWQLILLWGVRHLFHLRREHHRAHSNSLHPVLFGQRTGRSRGRRRARDHGSVRFLRHRRIGLALRPLSPSRLLFWYYGLRGLSLIYLPFADFTYSGLSVFALFYGLDWIATVPPTVNITVKAFGRDKANLVFGWVFAGHQMGAASAALGAGLSRTELATYLPAFMAAGVLCIVAAGTTLLLTPLRGAPTRQAPLRASA